MRLLHLQLPIYYTKKLLFSLRPFVAFYFFFFLLVFCSSHLCYSILSLCFSLSLSPSLASASAPLQPTSSSFLASSSIPPSLHPSISPSLHPSISPSLHPSLLLILNTSPPTEPLSHLYPFSAL
ncbi:hypothetical protein EDD21DRAFT_159983 [Dissophora ornata]|nr:hypothetical protein EDD21DRAFT_159983 [Dissophora ornata]